MTKDRTLPLRSTIAPFTPAQLRKLAAELRSIARGYPDAFYATKFRDRSDELHAEAPAIEQRERERRWYAARFWEWMKGR